MKVAVVLAGVAKAAVSSDRTMQTMKQMFEHYNGNDEAKFDKIQKYGCHCLYDLFSDTVLKEIGPGKPVDDLDSLCLEYKRCVKCVQSKLKYKGEENACKADVRKYAINGTGKCDHLKGCKQAVCECDVMFAKKFASVEGQYKEANKYGTMKEKEKKCLAGDNSGPVEKECCHVNAGDTKFWQMFNPNQKSCVNSELVDIGDW